SVEKPLFFHRESRLNDVGENKWTGRVVTRPCSFSGPIVSASGRNCVCNSLHCCRNIAYFF
ncbi:MAG TPA: hypothetical protein VIJ25_04170, partial [Methylococcales bacterium]